MTYVFNIATSHYECMVPLRYYTNEVVFAIEMALQSFYLTRRQATYAESFYSFKRSKITASGSIKPLSRIYIVISLFFETVLPYLRTKLEEILHRRHSEAPTQRKKMLIKMLGLVSRLGKLLVFAYSFRYLITGNSFPYFKPYYQWFGIAIRRLNSFEQKQQLQQPVLSRMLS